MRTGHRPLFTNLGRPFLTQLGERWMGNGASPQNCWPTYGTKIVGQLGGL